MAGKWKPTSLLDAGVSLIDCDHRTPPATDSGYPYIAIPQLKEGRIDLSDVRRISREHFVEWTRKAKPQHHDVILSRRCNPGETAYVPAGLDCALGQNLVLLRSDGTKMFPPFLRWLVRGPDWWEQIGTFINVGAVFDSLKCAEIPNFSMPLPPLAEQRAIAGVLGALDDKIESNRRTSQTLERVARAIFRAWFVDFEPVKAKATGARSFPGMPQEALDALSTRFVESELGPVPEGWDVGSIGDAVTVRGGGTPSTKVQEYWEGGTHCWLTPKDLSGMKDPILLSTDRKITDNGLENISSGLLPVGTVLLSSRAPVGYLVISGVPTAINQGFIAMVCDGPLPSLYVYHWTQSVMDVIKSHASGTTFPEISKTAFRPIKVCVPPKPVLESFTAAGDPLFGKLAASIRESHSLEKMRDYLLPKLLSGEVRVAADSVGSILEPTAAARERELGHE